MRRPLMAFLSVLGLGAGFAPAHAADLEWEVENPFRYYKVGSSFILHEKAYDAVRGAAENPIPADIVWRTERRLNDPDCKDKSTPAACARTAGRGYNTSRLGWAARTSVATCYDSVRRPRGYSSQCDRKYSWGTAKEDYVLPDAHTVTIELSAENKQAAGKDSCIWSWQPRAGGKTETKTLPCTDKLTISRVPYSTNAARSGVAVMVKLPDGRELADPSVIVEDLFVAALGDSFASGESNPDKPVTFSWRRAGRTRARSSHRPMASPRSRGATIPRLCPSGSSRTRRRA